MRSKFILLLMIFVFPNLFGQLNDTIFFKNGRVYPVFKVTGVYKDGLYYLPFKGHKELFVDTVLVSKYVTIENKNFIDNLSESNVDVENQIQWLKYNLKKYYFEQRLSQGIYMAAGLSGLLYGVLPKNENKNPIGFLYASGILGLTGYIIDLSSYRWLKKATLEPTFNSISLKIKL